jgi:hypothetical protein
MQHNNATDDFKKWEIAQSPMPRYVAEIDQTVVLLHNLTQKQKDSIGVGVPTSAEIKSTTEEALGPVAEAFGKALSNTSIISTLFTSLLPLAKGVIGKQQQDDRGTPAGTLNFMNRTALNYDILSVKDTISELKQNKYKQVKDIQFDDSSSTPIEKAIRQLRILGQVEIESKIQSVSYLQWPDSCKKLLPGKSSENDELLHQVIANLNSEGSERANSILCGLFGECQSAIENYRYSIKLLNWLNEETMQMLVLPTIKSEDDKKPAYRTVTYMPEAKLEDISNTKISYTVWNNKKSVYSRTIQKYKLSRLLPTFGLMYIFQPRESYTYDEAKKEFTAVKELDQFDAMAGIKWYPFKGISVGSSRKDKKVSKLEPCKRYAYKRGNSILNHSYISLGLSVRQKVFKNYFVGIGTDIVPGVGIQGGVNLYTVKTYTIENNKIKDEAERFQPKAYVGISLDLSLASDLVKFIIK